MAPPAPPERAPSALPWVRVADGTPYFVTDDGAAWTPVGQNDAVTWPDLAGLFRRRDVAAVDGHLRWLRDHGVTVLRVMLEYAQGEHRYLERPVGRVQPNMVRLWDDLVALCERHGMRLLLTPFDTFWMWVRWRRHPYNRRNGGPCASRRRWLVCPAMREAVKARLAFATERWGGSGALFAWDLWNEIHPAHGGVDAFDDFIADVGGFLRETELRLHGRAHPQTVSVFGPSLHDDPRVAPAVLAHPALDVASTHLYEHGTIDHPRNTVDAAVAVGRLVREALAAVPPGRPYFDSEHGPIHLFKDRRVTLPEPFDDAYFRHVQWAHLASGGAGGGMRWPNRHPHVLTQGMRAAQRSLAGFLPLVDWPRFRRRCLTGEAAFSSPDGAPAAAFACGDGRQAVAYLLRTGPLGADGRLRDDAPPAGGTLAVPGLCPGRYAVTAWDPAAGAPRAAWEEARDGAGPLRLACPPFAADLALAVRRLD